MDVAFVNQRNQRFASAVLPHLDAAYSLARWLLEDETRARDAVQSAALRALAYLDSLHGEDGRAWFLGIVRRQAFDALREQAARRGDLDLAAIIDGPDEFATLGCVAQAPDAQLLAKSSRARVNATLRALPVAQREMLVLRDIEDLSYQEIADISGLPIGTVMSRLARARDHFRRLYAAHPNEDAP